LRLFVAIYPPFEVIDHIARLVGDLRTAAGADVRLAVPAEMHLTLAFLGEVEDAGLPDVLAALTVAAGTWRLSRQRDDRSDEPAGAARSTPVGAGPAPRLRLGGGGSFIGERSTVLWVDLAGDRLALLQLANTVRRELDRAGLPYDARPFRPHLTLARVRHPAPGTVEADQTTLDRYAGPTWPMAEMVLMSSHLGPPPSYRRLATWPL
jgi:2'-5' RNA ligase